MPHPSFVTQLNKRLFLAMVIAFVAALFLTIILSFVIVFLMYGEAISLENLVSFDVSILTIPFFLLIFSLCFYFTQKFYTTRFVEDELVKPLKYIAHEIQVLRFDQSQDQEEVLAFRDDLVQEVDEIYRVLRHHISQFQSIYDKFDALMVTDHRTGLLRKDHMDACIRQEVFLAERYRRPFSITLVHLMKVDASLMSADEALGLFTGMLREETRKADSVFYINDKLFVIVSPETDYQGVKALQHSLKSRFNENDDVVKRYTFVMASATFGETDGLSYKELIATAKKRLQQVIKS